MKKNYLNASFYKFTEIKYPDSIVKPILEYCLSINLKGLIILAHEGINGTLSGKEDAIRDFFNFISRTISNLDLEYKESWSDISPFLRMKVRLKKEIVTLGVPYINPNQIVGEYVTPSEWNKLISNPDVVLIDTRNDYEVELGTFKGSINPNLKKFSSFPDWIENNYEKLLINEKKNKNRNVLYWWD